MACGARHRYGVFLLNSASLKNIQMGDDISGFALCLLGIWVLNIANDFLKSGRAYVPADIQHPTTDYHVSPIRPGGPVDKDSNPSSYWTVIIVVALIGIVFFALGLKMLMLGR